MTDEVAELVLDNNKAQTLALVIARRQALPMVNVHARYIDVLETEGWLDRGLEFLPTDKQIAERQAAGSGLQAPEFAVLIAYTKNANVAEMVRTRPARRRRCSRPTSSTTSRRRCASGYADAIRQHPLRREIIATRRRQPDGQPVGDLVRPPDDRGHRGVGRRRHAGVDRRPRGVRLRRAVGRDRRPRRRRPARRPARPVPRLPADGRARRRCGCCATAARRSTSPAAVAQFRPGIARAGPPARAGARRADGRRRALRRGVPAGGRRPEDLAERAGVWPLLHTGFDLVEVAAGPRPRRRRGGRVSSGRCSTAST